MIAFLNATGLSLDDLGQKNDNYKGKLEELIKANSDAGESVEILKNRYITAWSGIANSVIGFVADVLNQYSKLRNESGNLKGVLDFLVGSGWSFEDDFMNKGYSLSTVNTLENYYNGLNIEARSSTPNLTYSSNYKTYTSKFNINVSGDNPKDIADEVFRKINKELGKLVQ